MFILMSKKMKHSFPEGKICGTFFYFYFTNVSVEYILPTLEKIITLHKAHV